VKFLLDANFLVYCVRQKVDLVSELSRFGKPELFILDSVVEELEKIAEDKGSDGRAARVALLFTKESVGILKSEQKPDEGLVSKAEDYVICTNDRELIGKIKKEKGKIVSVRKNRILMML
jgi:rRNA-processing protein FCF1